MYRSIDLWRQNRISQVYALDIRWRIKCHTQKGNNFATSVPLPSQTGKVEVDRLQTANFRQTVASPKRSLAVPLGNGGYI